MLNKIASNYLDKIANDDLFTPANLFQALAGHETGWDANDPFNDKYFIRTKARWAPDTETQYYKHPSTGELTVWNKDNPPRDRKGNIINPINRSSSTAFGAGQSTEDKFIDMANDKNNPFARMLWNSRFRNNYHSARQYGRSLHTALTNKDKKYEHAAFDYGGNFGGMSRRDKVLYLAAMHQEMARLLNKYPSKMYTDQRKRLYDIALDWNQGPRYMSDIKAGKTKDFLAIKNKFETEYLPNVTSHFYNRNRAKFNFKPYIKDTMIHSLGTDVQSTKQGRENSLVSQNRLFNKNYRYAIDAQGRFRIYTYITNPQGKSQAKWIK